MRLVDLPRTSSFRLALRFLLLFGAAALLLFAFLYWQTNRYVLGRIDSWLVREQAIFDVLDRDTMVQRLTAHLVADPTLDRPLALFDRDGGLLAGTPLPVHATVLASMPSDVPFEFTLPLGRRGMDFRAVAHRTRSGDLMLVALNMEPPHAFAAVLVESFVWGGLITTLIGLAGAAVIGAGAVRRIDAITRATQRIVNGDLSERLPTHGQTDDLDRLAIVINTMLAEIERLMQEVKGVCDNIAHDLRTPLTRLLAGLERTSRRAVSTADYAAAIDEAVVETKAVLDTFAAMLRIAEVESGARRAGFTDTDLSQVIADAVELYEPVAEQNGIDLLRLTPVNPPALLRGDPSLLFEAVGNLVDNALKFTPRGGRVTVRGFSGSDTIGFEVIDSGPGIPPEEVPCVLRRFYRTESSRHTAGSGLGLALVAAVAQLHGMDLAIGDAQPGCRVTLARRQDVFAPAGKPLPETAPGHPQPATGHPAALMEAREPGRQPDTRDGSA